MAAPPNRTFMGNVTMIVPTALVWSITPASWIFFAYHLLRGRLTSPHGGFYRLVLYHAYGEIPFSIFLYYLTWKAQARRKLEGATIDEMRRLFIDCLEVGILDEDSKETRGKIGERVTPSGRTGLNREDVGKLSAQSALLKFRQWFFEAPLDSIKYDNAYEWVAWAMVDSDPRDLTPGSPEVALVAQGVDWLQHRLHHTFPPGCNPDVKSIRLSLDPVKALHRPLGYYVVCNLVTFGMYAYLDAHSFKFEKHGNCTFLCRSALPSYSTLSSPPLPTFFVHGLGIGLGQYAMFFHHLVQQPQPIMILIQPNISVQIYDKRFLDPPGKEAHVEAFKMICEKKGYKGVTVLSHSNGTMVHSWLLRGAKDLCRRNILADPVSFRLWEADVCYTFLHKPWNTSLEILLGYFVARELGTAHTIARLFVWTDMMLWEHEFPSTRPEDLQVILGSADFLIDAPRVLDYLQATGVRDECITLVRGAPHGAALIAHGQGMKKVLSSL